MSWEGELYSMACSYHPPQYVCFSANVRVMPLGSWDHWVPFPLNAQQVNAAVITSKYAISIGMPTRLVGFQGCIRKDTREPLCALCGFGMHRGNQELGMAGIFISS